MSIANLHTLTQAEFDATLKAVLAQLEDSLPLPYFGIAGLITIGIGLNINPSGPARTAVYDAMGLTAAERSALNTAIASSSMTAVRGMTPGSAKDRAMQGLLDTALGRAFAMTQSQIDSSFANIAQSHINAVSSLVQPLSLEKIALTRTALTLSTVQRALTRPEANSLLAQT
jgi:hypothetical protein